MLAIAGVKCANSGCFYSGAAYESDKQKALAAGAKEYLVKPNVEDVVPTILKFVIKAVEIA